MITVSASIGAAGFSPTCDRGGGTPLHRRPRPMRQQLEKREGRLWSASTRQLLPDTPDDVPALCSHRCSPPNHRQEDMKHPQPTLDLFGLNSRAPGDPIPRSDGTVVLPSPDGQTAFDQPAPKPRDWTGSRDSIGLFSAKASAATL